MFHEHWRTIHLEHALRIKPIRRYVQLHATGDAVPGFAKAIYDGVPEVWFDDLPAAAGLSQDPDYTEYAGRDEPNFIDMSRITAIPTTETVFLPGPRVDVGTSLVKGLILMGKSAGRKLGEFTGWWQDWLGPVVAEMVPGLVRHVQCLAVPEAYASTSPAYDGLVELWWSDENALKTARTRLESLSASLGNSPADPSKSVSLIGTELRVRWP
jgi:hypothetical protein